MTTPTKITLKTSNLRRYIKRSGDIGARCDPVPSWLKVFCLRLHFKLCSFVQCGYQITHRFNHVLSKSFSGSISRLLRHMVISNWPPTKSCFHYLRVGLHPRWCSTSSLEIHRFLGFGSTWYPNPPNPWKKKCGFPTILTLPHRPFAGNTLVQKLS